MGSQILLSTLLVFALALVSGCLPFGLGGSLGGEELAFEEAVYFELRGTDPGTAVPFHDLQLWLTPLSEPCERLPALLSELAALRQQQQDGLAPADYCNAWETLMSSYLGEEPFWHAQIRMKALPRPEDIGLETSYAFHDEATLDLAAGPNFDADVLYYPAADFDACAEEFSGSSNYQATIYPALAGDVQLKSYAEDSTVETELSLHFAEPQGEPLRGASKASYCIPARDFPLEFGLGF
tara:strand:+ start:1707 stop:2423 length:717 start_codon:yes stop_codon:yes gene_type:complete